MHYMSQDLKSPFRNVDISIKRQRSLSNSVGCFRSCASGAGKGGGCSGFPFCQFVFLITLILQGLLALTLYPTFASTL